MTYLDRYQQGDCEAVWAELQALGEEVNSRKLRDDARAVAMETMRRARANLTTMGAKIRPPHKRTAETIKALEKQLQTKLPLSLHAWWLQIGEVASDELTILPLDAKSIFKPPPPFFPPKDAWQTSNEAWRRTLLAEGNSPEETEAKLAAAIAEFEAQDRENERLAALPFTPGFRHQLTPDDLITTGYNVLLPQPTADFPLENAEGTPLFVAWLRRHCHLNL